VIRLWAALAGLMVALALGGGPASANSDHRPIGFADMPGWAGDDHAEALVAFRVGCSRPVAALKPACAAAKGVAAAGGSNRARAFFEDWFRPHLISGAGKGFFTGYYEPEYAGSRTPSARHSAPILSMPAKLPSPAPDRAAIEQGALRGQAQALVWLDPVDAFFVHIQGSARIRLDGGTVIRVGFAGRNGHAFTPIGRVLVERGELTLDQVSMQTIRAWMERHPGEAAGLMRQNRSYIFFRTDERGAGPGPIGAQQVPLTPGRSLAVDRAHWQLGLPVWVSTRLPRDAGGAVYRRLLIAQDTGAAIKGPARGDVFLGTGADAGVVAGLMKEPGDFIVLLPRTPGRR
jgi:membrane-bound lytic murein transglycosylase A